MAVTIVNPLRRFLLAVLAWLPLCFFFWWWVSSIWVWVPVHIAGPVLTHLWSSVFEAYAQHGAEMEVATRVMVSQAAPAVGAGAGQVVLTPNPMIYGYSLPLYVALVMATPLVEDRRWGQLFLGVFLIFLGQAFGLVSETWKLLAFDTGPNGVAALHGSGMGIEVVALCYQFGYLIVPAVLPPVLWLAQNRVFTDILVGRVTEPAAGAAGPT
jgi:hypothetical protein